MNLTFQIHFAECNNEEKESDNGLQDQRVWSAEECASIFRQRLVIILDFVFKQLFSYILSMHTVYNMFQQLFIVSEWSHLRISSTTAKHYKNSDCIITVI